MIKPLLRISAALTLFALPLAAQDVTKTGTVVDVSCYSALGLAGPSHRACAETCAHAGVPMAIMIDGVIYMPVSPKPNYPQTPRLTPFVESKVKVTGTLKDVAGLHTIVIKSIEAAS